VRGDGAGAIYGAFNLGTGAGKAQLPDGNWTPIGAELGAVAPGSDGRVSLGPWDFCLAVRT
jgi:alpha-glucosidase